MRDRLLAELPASEVLVVGGTSHTSFTDPSAYMSPLGRGLTGDDGSQASRIGVSAPAELAG